MDSSSLINLSEIINKLKCGYCSHTLSEPRMLHCNHQFCKKCLDSLLDFHHDGSAVIRCPKGCTKLTKIMCVDTTNELDVDYRVIEILEMVEEKVDGEDRERPTCETCDRDVMKCSMSYCVPCQKFKCESCEDPHDADIITGNSFFPVKFDAREKEWDVLCEEHSTAADSMCCETQFVCVYCRNRKHQGHIKCESLDTAQETLKKVLTDGLKFTQDYNNARNITTRNISSVKSTFEELLKVKKLKRVDDYMKHLNSEEEKLKREFSLVTAGHTKFFNRSDSAKYLKECLEKKRLELLFRKTDIMELVQSQNRVIRETTVSLTESHFNDEHPLGCLNVVNGEHIPIEQSGNSFRSKLPDDHVDQQQPSLMRSVFYQSVNIRSYIQGLGKAIRQTEMEQDEASSSEADEGEDGDASSGCSCASLNMIGDDGEATSPRRRTRLKRRVKEKTVVPNDSKRAKKKAQPPPA